MARTDAFHPEPAVSVIVLCGGESTRLGGIDKPLRALAGQALVDRVLARLPPAAQRILVANRNSGDYAQRAAQVVDDGPWRHCGPLAGIAAGLAAAPPGEVLCVPGDAPRLPTDLLPRLRAAARAAGARAAVVDDGDGWQPLCCLLHTDQQASLQAALQAGVRAPRDWLRTLPAAVADCSDSPRWAWSLNTPQEWAAAEALLAPEQAA